MFLYADMIEQTNVHNNQNMKKNEERKKNWKMSKKKKIYMRRMKQWMTTCTSLWLTWNVNQVSIIGNSDGDGLVTIRQTNCDLFHLNEKKKEGRESEREKMTSMYMGIEK